MLRDRYALVKSSQAQGPVLGCQALAIRLWSSFPLGLSFLIENQRKLAPQRLSVVLSCYDPCGRMFQEWWPLVPDFAALFSSCQKVLCGPGDTSLCFVVRIGVFYCMLDKAHFSLKSLAFLLDWNKELLQCQPRIICKPIPIYMMCGPFHLLTTFLFALDQYNASNALFIKFCLLTTKNSSISPHCGFVHISKYSCF